LPFCFSSKRRHTIFKCDWSSDVCSSDLTQWESQGKGTVIISPNKLRLGKWQFRDSSAWWAGDPRIRHALTKLVDRQAIVDTILRSEERRVGIECRVGRAAGS